MEDLVHACQFYNTPRGITRTNARLGTQAKNSSQGVESPISVFRMGLQLPVKTHDSLDEYSKGRKTPYNFQELAITQVLNKFESGSNSAL